jgi:hypothetical protein
MRIFCPHCHKRLRTRGSRRNFCEVCGARIGKRRRWVRAVVFSLIVGISVFAFLVRPFTAGVDKRLIGRWQVIEGRADGTLVEFTPGGKLVYTETGGGQKVTKIGSYRFSGRNSVQLADEDGKVDAKLNIEFVSSDSLICANDNPYCTFNCLSGKLVRVPNEEDMTKVRSDQAKFLAHQ